jgi:hypothetical protein
MCIVMNCCINISPWPSLHSASQDMWKIYLKGLYVINPRSVSNLGCHWKHSEFGTGVSGYTIATAIIINFHMLYSGLHKMYAVVFKGHVHLSACLIFHTAQWMSIIPRIGNLRWKSTDLLPLNSYWTVCKTLISNIMCFVEHSPSAWQNVNTLHMCSLLESTQNKYVALFWTGLIRLRLGSV